MNLAVGKIRKKKMRRKKMNQQNEKGKGYNKFKKMDSIPARVVLGVLWQGDRW